ncbi:MULTISPECIES: YxiG family protein [unclassified Lysinibacillus]|uniref:YxiG family protein n=1 Tax=unclassified Lysinibacillus TaxID=2636778 RepID=UPI0030F8855C
MEQEKIMEEIQMLLSEEVEFGVVMNVDIGYFGETVKLVVAKKYKQEVLKKVVFFEQVLSFYMCQLENIEGIRLNDYDYGDEQLLTGISYHPNGVDKITIESLDPELKGIEEISSTTNFSFHINNKACFFIEANRVVFEGKFFKDLIAPENELKWEDES